MIAWWLLYFVAQGQAVWFAVLWTRAQKEILRLEQERDDLWDETNGLTRSTEVRR